ncbi:MAG: hypothetical protein FJZ86_16130 [Chloroflexi bacterium]|nr:hypothetical protein [Chloroflexota bacterium]
MKKGLKSCLIVVLVLVGLCIGGAAVMFFSNLCPPQGPWPMPPWCAGGSGEFTFNLPFESSLPPTKLPADISDFDISKPEYPGSRDAFTFPPSCDLIPDKIAQSVCEYYKEGAIIFWQEEACDAMPLASGKDACKNERAELRKIGDEKIAELRKTNPEWWKRPDLNVYVYGDTHLRTEELRPDVSVWGGGSYDGWRNDEIFMTHAAGIFKVVGHSFGYLGENDLDYMRNRLMADEGIVITGPADLQKPEVVRIKTDLAYLESKSPIFRGLVPAIAKDFDNQDVVVGFTFPDGSKRISNISANAIVPEFKNYLIQYYKWQVDANADGMFIDDLTGLYPADSFSDAVMKQFGAWLAARPDKSALEKYEVADWTAFNYREFLKRAGYTKTTIDNTVGKTIGASDAWRQIPLMVEFRTFLIEANQKALIDIITEVKAYAREKGRDNFIATGNTGELAPGGAFAVPYFDYLTFEHAYLRNDNPLMYQSVMPLTHLAEAKERPVANQILVDNWNPLAEMTSQPLKLGIMRLVVMESYAAGSGTSYVRYALNDPREKSQNMNDVYFALEDRFDLIGIQKAYGFMRHNLATFRDFTNSTAKVAVILDNDEIIREWKESITADHQYSVENISKTLDAAGIAYDVINWKQLAGRAGNKQYQFVILPAAKSAGNNFEATLQKAKDAGAKIISVDGTPEAWLRFVDINSSEAAVVSVLKSVPVLNLPPKMKAVVKTDAKGNFVVHLMNYDYDASGFREQKNIAIDMAFFGSAKKVTFASLENPEQVELDAAKPIVPGVTTYGMLIIEK